MRILYIVTAFPRHPDDIITPWLTETIRWLATAGIEVEVLAPSYRGSREQRVEGIRVHRFRYAPARFETLTHDQTVPDRLRERPLHGLLLPGYLVGGALSAARLARTGRFDVVHAFWPLPHGLFGMAARRAGGMPLVTTFFGVELSWVRRDLPFLAPLVRGIIRRSDAVTAISTATAEAVRQVAPGTSIRTIPFGAAIRPVPSPGPPAPPDGRFRVLFVGRLVERKGVSYLLEALTLIDRDLNLLLSVVGDGPLRGSLERRARQLGVDERVEFTGALPAEEVASRFRDCDVFVLPAVQDAKGDEEGLGVVLIEALLHGKAVIASDSGGIRDVVIDGETGMLVPPRDPAALARAIRRLRDDPALAGRLGSTGRDFALQRFSWDAVGGELAQLYRDVVREIRGGPSPVGADG